MPGGGDQSASDMLTLSPHRIKAHHLKCPNRHQNSINTSQNASASSATGSGAYPTDQLITVMVPLIANTTSNTSAPATRSSPAASIVSDSPMAAAVAHHHQSSPENSEENSRCSSKKFANDGTEKLSKAAIRLRLPISATSATSEAEQLIVRIIYSRN